MQKQMGRFKAGGNAAATATKLAPGAAQPGALTDAPQIRQSLGGATPNPPLSTTNANPRASMPAQTP